MIQGADPKKLSNAVKKLADEANRAGMDDGGELSSTDAMWLGAELPRGYIDVTDQVDVTGLELLNWESSLGNARTLFQGSKPKGKNGTKYGSYAIADKTQARRLTQFRATQTSS